MAERLPFPTQVNSSSSAALDPTAVIPRPQPLDQVTFDGVKIISGEVVTGSAPGGGPAPDGPVTDPARHRGARARRSGRGAVGTAVLSAAGAVAGLSLLMSHESADTSAGKSEPVRTAPDKAAAKNIDPSLTAASVSAPLKATGARPETAETTVPRSATKSTEQTTTSSSGATSSSSSGRHARPGGSWDSSDWQEATERAAAAQRAAQQEQEQGNGRHRANESWYGDQYGGGGYGYGSGNGYGYRGGGYGGGNGYGYDP